MAKCLCDICGAEYDAYGEDPFTSRKTDGIAIRVYDRKTMRFNIKHYWTCRDCAIDIRAMLDRRARETREARDAE